MKLAFPVATPETEDDALLALRGPLGESFHLLAEFGYGGAELMARDPRRLGPDEIQSLAARPSSRPRRSAPVGCAKAAGSQLCALDGLARRRAVGRGENRALPIDSEVIGKW